MSFSQYYHLFEPTQQNRSQSILQLNQTQQQTDLFEFDFLKIASAFWIVIFVGIGQSAGVGGGSITVPILISVFQYDSKKSIAIIFVIIFIASFLNIKSFLKLKTNGGVSLIDYQLVLVCLPSLLLGSTYGVILNIFLPEFFVMGFLIYYILMNVKKTYKQYKAQQQKEQSNFVGNENKNQVFGEIEAFDKQTIKWIVLITFSFALFSLVKGSKKMDSIVFISFCGQLYWLSIALLVPLTYFLCYLIYQFLNKNQIPSLLEDNNQITFQQIKRNSKVAFQAGLIGAIIGIGGGMILVPAWIEMGISPTRAATSSLFLILLTSFNNFIQYYLSDIYFLDEIVYFSTLAFLSSFVAQYVKKYVQKNNKDSLLIIIIFWQLIAAFAIMGSIITLNAIEDINQLIQFGNVC